MGVDPDWALKQNDQVDFRVLAVAEHLPFESACFDLILADWVVEHLPDPNGMAANYRVLKPGGRFVFRTGNVLALQLCGLRRHATLVPSARGKRSASLPSASVDPYPTHYRMNTCRDVRRVLRRAGLLEEKLALVEAEPSYLVFSVPSFLLGVAYERLVNHVSPLARFRACLFGCFRKEGVGPPRSLAGPIPSRAFSDGC